MSNLIDRQEAIDAFMTATSDGDKADWCKYVLKQLPSAQPEQLGTNLAEVGTDCISRQAAIDT